MASVEEVDNVKDLLEGTYEPIDFAVIETLPEQYQQEFYASPWKCYVDRAGLDDDLSNALVNNFGKYAMIV